MITASSVDLTNSTINGVSGAAAAQYVIVTETGSGPFTADGQAAGTVPQPTQHNNNAAAQTVAQTNNVNANPVTNDAAGTTAPMSNPPVTETTVVPQNVVAADIVNTPMVTGAASDVPTTVTGIDSGAATFVAISPTSTIDLTASTGSSNPDTIVIADANPAAVKAANNAEPTRPQVVHPIGAYLNQMLTPTMPRNGVPGISFGYSLSGNSALW